MARIKIKGIDEVSKRLSTNLKIELNKVFRSPELRNFIGDAIVDDIRKNYSKQPSDVTLAFREFYEQFNATHPEYVRSKINITFTGKLLEDLAKNVKSNTNELTFVVAHSKKKHPGYKSGTGEKVRGKKVMVTSLKSKKTRQLGTTFSKQQKSYEEISGYLVGMGYDYFIVTQKTSDKIVNKVREELFKLLTNI